jgi:DNA polymerase-4
MPGSPERWILHADLDEFFAAVERIDDPSLVGRPLLVGGRPEARGVVATASYEARRFGCRSAMPMSKALRLCPEAVVLPPRFDRYEEFSRQLHAIFDRYSPLVEPLGLDEAFLDLSGTETVLGPAPEAGRRLKTDIRRELGLVCSIGLGPNKFLAKLASDLEKPDGFTVIRAEEALAILDPLPVRRLWGVGPVGERRLRELGITSIGDLRRCSRGQLVDVLGAEEVGHLLRLAQGLDDRPVESDRGAKSIGSEETFPKDIAVVETLRRILLEQADLLAWRLRRLGLRARQVTIKLRDGAFRTQTRSTTLEQATDVTRELAAAARILLDRHLREDPRPLRLLGLIYSGLTDDHSRQTSFIEDEGHERQVRLDASIDALRQRFGAEMLRRAGTLPPSTDDDHGAGR